MKWSAVITAAGIGTRMGNPLPKQYQCLQFAGQYEAVLTQSVRQLLPFVEAVQIVIHKDHEDLYKQVMADLQDEKILPFVFGSSTRQESVHLGLEALPESEFVLIHDAARPYVSGDLIQSLQEAAEQFGTAVPCLPTADSVCVAEDGKLIEYLDRTKLQMIQTPQAFHQAQILQAHQNCKDKSFADDASLAMANGVSVAMVVGEVANKKITYGEDLVNSHEYRMTSGFDVHALGDGDGVKLCGVKIPHNKSLQGHSDADVALHALCDAMLAAAGEADIGQQFPPTDPEWKNADSSQFIKFAMQKLQGKNMEITFADITIICEERKVHLKVMMTNYDD